MFTAIFWILLVWFVVNIIWMWFVMSNANAEKTFAWINVAAVIIGFLVYFTASRSAGVAPWLLALNIVNIVVAIVQFVLSYRSAGHSHSAHQA